MMYKITLSMLLCAGLITNEAAAQMKLQSKTEATYRTAGSYTEDSVHYFHSGTKGNNPGKYKIPEFTYMEDSSQVFEYNTTSKKLEWVSRKVCTYTGTDFNESITYTINNGSWRNSQRVRIIYAAGKPDTVYYDNWNTQGSGSWRASSRIIYTWTGNNVATRLRQTRGRQNWSNSRLWSYQYNGNNETEYIDQKWNNNAWQDTIKRTTTIAAGKITKVELAEYSGGNWNPKAQSFYTYDGSSRLIKIEQEIYFQGNWDKNRIDTNIYNSAAAFPDTTIKLAVSFGNFINEGKFGYEYLGDASGRPTSLVTQSWDGISVWKQTDNQDSIIKWRYGFNVSVENVNDANTTLSVYPSPATDNISITMDGMNTDKTVHFAIVDMQGRLIKNWNGEVKPVTTMSISELTAGNYILLVSNGTQKVSKQFVVSK